MVRTPYNFCDKSGLKKGTWAPEEDWKLIAHVNAHGHKNWRQLPKLAGLARCGKSCRLRWMNYLRPGIKRGNYTYEEEETIINLRASLGNRWSVIASHLPGRSDNEIKNHWHAHLKKRFQQHDEASTPKNHSPVPSIHEDNKYYSVEADASPFQNPDHASPSSQNTSLMSNFFCVITEPAPAASSTDVNLVIDDGFTDFMEENIDPISAYSWQELYEMSYVSGEFLVPFVTESESFCPLYDV